MLTLFLLQAGQAPIDCLMTGLCGVAVPVRPVAPGLLFVAVGLVALGVRGLRHRAG